MVVYGPTDTRLEVYEGTAEQQASVPSRNIVCETRVTDRMDAHGRWAFTRETTLQQRLLEIYQHAGAKTLDQNIRFSGQNSSGIGTVWLIAENVVVSAGHNYWSFNPGNPKIDFDSVNALTDYLVVFDWIVDLTAVIAPTFTNDQVYAVDRIRRMAPGSVGDPGAPDFMIMRLTRPVAHRNPLQFAEEVPAANSPCWCAGSPAGIPMKISRGSVLKVGADPTQPPGFLHRTDLTHVAGNSGSPVLNGENEVIGILVTGDEDFLVDQSGTVKANVIKAMTAGSGCNIMRTDSLRWLFRTDCRSLLTFTLGNANPKTKFSPAVNDATVFWIGYRSYGQGLDSQYAATDPLNVTRNPPVYVAQVPYSNVTKPDHQNRLMVQLDITAGVQQNRYCAYNLASLLLMMSEQGDQYTLEVASYSVSNPKNYNERFEFWDAPGIAIAPEGATQRDRAGGVTFRAAGMFTERIIAKPIWSRPNPLWPANRAANWPMA